MLLLFIQYNHLYSCEIIILENNETPRKKVSGSILIGHYFRVTT